MSADRVLRPKEKRKVSSMLSDSVMYAEDQEISPAQTSKKTKKTTDGEKKEKKKKTTKKKSSSSSSSRVIKEKGGEVEYDFSKVDSDEDENALVIDDPDAFYVDDYNSEEERRKRNEEKKEREEEQIKMEEILKKKKKTRHANLGVKKYSEVPLDEQGNPKMPILLKGLTIFDLGKIVCDKDRLYNFHAKRYIWPVGFKSSRLYGRYVTWC